MNEAAAQFFVRARDAGPAVTDSIGSFGLSWNDYNNDGLIDLYVSGVGNQMYRNNGNGTFARILTGPFVNTEGFTNVGVWADYDNDGNLDLFLSNYGVADQQGNITKALPAKIYRNSGAPDFALMPLNFETDAAVSISGTWIDYDQDGDADLYVPRAQGYTDRFYRNEGNDTFVEETGLAFLRRRTEGVAESWVDYDGDGDEDLFIVNRGSPNELFKSLLKETGDPNQFQAITNTPLTSDGSIFDIGASWADYDNDGDFDVFLAVSGVFGSGLADRLYRNDGSGVFTQITSGPVVTRRFNTAFGSWGDFDNDGDLDLFVGEVNVGTSTPSLYRNDGAGNFTATDSLEMGEILSPFPGPQGGGWGDYDNDGDLDIYVLHVAQPTTADPTRFPVPNFLIRNEQGNRKRWLSVQVRGELTNRSALGAIIKLKAVIDGRPKWQTRYLATLGQSGLNSQAGFRAHFGLGEATQADSLVIAWPSGIVQTLTGIATNQFLVVNESVPNGYLRADFRASMIEAVNTDTLAVQFFDRTLSQPSLPPNSWKWDFDGDGVIDATTQHPTWTYTRGDTYTVRLEVTNGVRTETKTRVGFIKVSGLLPKIEFDTRPVLLGDLENKLARVDTTFKIYNRGLGEDSVFVRVDPANVNPTTAVAVAPQTFQLAPLDSQTIVFTVYPQSLPASNTLLRPKVIVQSQRTHGVKSFEKTCVFRIKASTNVEQRETTAITGFNLAQNFPNPFNPATTIRFTLPQASEVVLAIYNSAGRLVRKLIEGKLRSGEHQIVWDGADLQGRQVTSGVYLCMMQAGKSKMQRKLVLMH